MKMKMINTRKLERHTILSADLVSLRYTFKFHS